MAKVRRTPVEVLNNVVADTASHIQDYTKSPNDFIRNRKLNAQTTLSTILNMQGNSLNAELLDAFPDPDERMTASAFEQAKNKLTPAVFEHILKQLNMALPATKLLDNKYRVLAIDGSDFTTPYNPKSNRILHCNQYTGSSAYVCQTHANIVYDIANRTYQDCILEPKTKCHEGKAALSMLERFDKTNPFIVIMDRGYESLNMIEHCNRIDNCFYAIRVRTGNGGIREIAALPDEECDIDFDIDITTSATFYKQHKDTILNLHHINRPRKSHKVDKSKKTSPQSWDFEDRCHLKFRAVKFKINTDGKNTWEVIITNLNRSEFSIERMKELYHMRWDIETSFRSLKYALGAINFHSKKDDFIDMEILAHLIMYNVVSQSIEQVEVIHQNTYAVDFKMACHIVRQYYHRLNDKPYEQIYSEIRQYINPVRPGRADKRRLKTKPPIWFVYRVA